MRITATTGAALLALSGAVAGPHGAHTFEADTATSRLNASAPPASATLPAGGGEAPPGPIAFVLRGPAGQREVRLTPRVLVQ